VDDEGYDPTTEELERLDDEGVGRHANTGSEEARNERGSSEQIMRAPETRKLGMSTEARNRS